MISFPSSFAFAFTFLLIIGSSLNPLGNGPQFVRAATKDQWRTRSIYQLITDRFAPPTATSPAITAGIPSDGTATCADGTQTFCGGNWRSIIDRLDYIQGMGFDSIWISPTSLNLDNETAYGMAYHGYWVQDPTKLNPRFGTEADLLALSAELHKRDMFFMVDIVVNNVAVTPAATIGDILAVNPNVLFRNQSEYHPECWIDYSNSSSVDYCWMGDAQLPLPDVNTEDAFVISTLQAWIKDFVQKFSVDGLRIDAAKHAPGVFWKGFCEASGVFCIGEAYTTDVAYASTFQTEQYMDSVLNFPTYYGVVDAFFPTSTAPLNMSSLVDIYGQVQKAFPDVGVLGSFLGNHDLPRYNGLQVDPRTAWNALVWQFLNDGIPVAFYADEQAAGRSDHQGSGDPYNRQALWTQGAKPYDTTAAGYVNTKQLNAIRDYLITSDIQLEGQNFLNTSLTVLASNKNDFVYKKGPIVVFLTNRGSPSASASIGVQNIGWEEDSVVNLLECTISSLGSNSSIAVSWAAAGAGGKPYVFMGKKQALASGLCPSLGNGTVSQAQSVVKNDAGASASIMSATSFAVVLASLSILSVFA